ncbi:MAG: YdeI/OmpD-associated family protein [Patescibacteria group bacterium]
MQDTYETIEFSDAESFRQWLDAHYESVDGVWLKIQKKGSIKTSVTNAEALDIALCYGWIDGLRRGLDENSYLQKFTPRRAKSLWSKRNITYIDRLTKAGLMKPSGLKEVHAAMADGRWDAAYDGPSTMTLPDSFMHELGKHPKAKAQFELLNKTARYAIGWQLQTAKTEKTIEARQKRIIEKLEED